MATRAVNPGARIQVAIGAGIPEREGWLHMHDRDHADVPFRLDEEFPFADDAVEIARIGSLLDHATRAQILQFIMECRRVLVPGGLLRIAASAPRSILDSVVALAGLIGARADDLLPSARRALAGPHTEDIAGPAFTKPSRVVTSDPRVSIAIPAYNARFFAECLDSALAQSYHSLEIVICDDSADPVIESIVRSRAPTHTVRYLRNETRQRPRGNFIRCLEQSEGEFIKFLCDDDLLAPRCVATLVGAFRHAPNVSLATSRRGRIDAAGRPLYDQPATLPPVLVDSIIAGATLANAMVMVGLNTVGEPSTTLFRKSDLLGAAPGYFGFDGNPAHGIIDFATWTALLLRGDAVYLREPLSSFRVHSDQRQHDPTKMQRNMQSIRSLQDAWLRLELQTRMQPDMLRVRPFPYSAADDWREERVNGVAAHPIAGLRGDGARREVSR